jgi:hypothetical protein
MGKRKGFMLGFLLVSLIFLIPQFAAGQFSFVVTADQRTYTGPGTYDEPNYYKGVIEAIANRPGGSGVFMVSPGDIDPPADSKWTIEQYLGPTYPWFPVVGNHELPGAGDESSYGANMVWLRNYDYGIVNPGPSGCPETTYSFDYENVHFVMLNEYCDFWGDDITHGDIPDHLFNWLVADLSAVTEKHIFVFGHEPAYPQPDADTARTRHMTDSLNQYPNNRDRFWSLLKDMGVMVYFCGHTHNFSVYHYDGVWQLDVGHARGAGDTGAPSTFVMVNVDGSLVTYDAYRDSHDGNYDYDDIIHSGNLSSIGGCGNDNCETGEDSCNCLEDCGLPLVSEEPTLTCTDSKDNDCDDYTDCDDNDCAGDPACLSDCNNNGVCEQGEDCNTCSNDCISGGGGTSGCGNGICEPDIGEGCLSCAIDCAGRQVGKFPKRFCCGDGDGTNPVGCGDPRCTKGEFDCGPFLLSYCCGDGACEGAEDSNNCELDCGPPQEPFCGNGVCESGEDSASCPADCSSCIPTKECNCNGKCGKKENFNCPDCW